MDAVRALPLLGVTPENVGDYSVRLSKVMPRRDPNEWLRYPSPEAHDRLYDYLFGYVWPDTAPRRRHSIRGRVVLQFLQVERGVSVYRFMGAFKVGELVELPSAGLHEDGAAASGALSRVAPSPLVIHEWRGNEIMDLHHLVDDERPKDPKGLKGLRVRYVRPAGYCGMDYRLSHRPFAESMLEGMVVEQVG